jgi:hypothetical protein
MLSFNLQLNLLTNFDTVYSSVSLDRRLKTRLALLLESKVIPLHRHAIPTSSNRKGGGKNDATNQDILPQIPKGVRVE